jgi:hypothetical protein
MRGFRFFVLATAAAGGVLLAPAPARAHALHADVVVATEVKLLAYFDDDVPAEFAEAIVTDSNGTAVLTGKTNERGVWVFPRPKPGTYLVSVSVKAIGHTTRVEFTVPAEPDAPAAAFGDPRPNQTLGLALGLVGLLGFSATFWFIRRARRVK